MGGAMKRVLAARLLLIGAMSLAGAIRPAVAAEQPVNTLRELSQALRECARIHVPPSGSEITVIFSLKRDGLRIPTKPAGDSDLKPVAVPT